MYLTSIKKKKKKAKKDKKTHFTHLQECVVSILKKNGYITSLKKAKLKTVNFDISMKEF